MSVSVQIDPRSIAAMRRMQDALALYAANSSRSPAKFLADATSKLLLGEDVEGGGRNEGLFGRLAALSPAAGQAEEEAKARGYRMGRPNSTSLSIARERVNELLGRGESGVFKWTSGKGRSALTLGSIYTKGRRKGLINFRARPGRLKNQYLAVVSWNDQQAQSRRKLIARRAAESGGMLLNRQAAIVAIAIRRREAARRASAVQFLPSRYRRTLARLKGVVYRSGQAVGMRGGSADMWKYHFHERALVSNKKGRELGEMIVTAQGKAASAEIIGRLGLHTAAQQSALSGSMSMVADYALRRALSRVKDDAAKFHRWMQIDASA